MQDIVYYVRDRQGRPAVTVTLTLLGDSISRGISLYRAERGWVLKRMFGQNESLLRAAKAMQDQENIGVLSYGTPIDYTRPAARALRKAMNIKDQTTFTAIELALIEGFGVKEKDFRTDEEGTPFHVPRIRLYRGMYNPVLTDRELRLVRSHWRKYIDGIDKFCLEYQERTKAVPPRIFT